MTYQIIIPKTVQKQLNKLPNTVAEKIIEAIIQLRDNPRLPNSLKMQNSQGYRLRVGEYRVLYDINDKTQVVTLRRLGHRRDIYR